MTLLTVCLLVSIAAYCSNAAFLVPTIQTQKKDSKGQLRVATKPVTGSTWNNTSDKVAGDQHSWPQLAAAVQNKLPFLHARTNGSWGTGVVHFLFLVNDNLPHAAIWQKFFAKAPQGSWKALVHCKDPAGCAKNGVFHNNPGFISVTTTPTWYCHDLVTAMAHLVSRALELRAASYGDREKFVFLSESTLPVKPFSEIHGTLLLDDNSDFCLFPSNQWASASIDGSFVKMLKHHQWVVLSRAHAEMFARDWVSVNARSEWRIWLRTGTWEGHQRYVYPRSFYYPAAANTCTDEWAFTATIFGALEPMSGTRYLPGFGGGHIDMSTSATQGRCRTWSYWDNEWDHSATALASQIANDFYGSSMSCFPKCHARPAELKKVSTSSLHALRRSPFLFARKFSPSIWMPNFDSIILDA